MMIKEQTIFLDRDGVINRNRARGDYVKTWEEFEFLPGVLDAIARLKKAGYRLQQLRIIQPSTDCQATQPEFRRRFFKNKRPY